MTSYKRLRVIMLFLSIFTLTAVAKAVYQKYAGFDETETTMLIETEMYKTHLLSDVTRYFSFFTDAGNFGSNMGFAAILFGISAIFIKERSIRIYYAIIAVCSIYALFISGTRGALFVPIGGIILLTFLSKNIKLMGATVFFGLFFMSFSPIPISVKATLPSDACVQLSDLQKTPHTLSAKKTKKNWLNI